MQRAPSRGARAFEGDLDFLSATEHPDRFSNAPASNKSTSSAPPVSHRERDDDYRDVVCRLDANRRVINCKDDIQWIEQIRQGGQWRGHSFFRHRSVLIERSGATGAALAILRQLAEVHP